MGFLLEMKNVSKSFGNNLVLKGVNIQLHPGEVLALLGENGAGKSTLIKILGGIHTKDSGEIWINGQKQEIACVTDAQKSGIRIIHQEIILVPERTIADNIFLGREPQKHLGFIDREQMLRDTQALIDSFDFDFKADMRISELSLGKQQLVEILKAISTDARIIVMDEPTSSLSEYEVNILFSIIEKLKMRGVGIIFISHKIPELYRIADRVTVLRDGMAIETAPMQQIDKDRLISLMVGRTLTNYYIKTENNILGKSLEVRSLCSKRYFKNISFYARYGEIVGFSGLVGAGRSEVMKAIFGMLPVHGGELLMDGRKLCIRKPADALNAGIAYIPENRREEGLILRNTVTFNMTLVALRQIMRGLSNVHRKKEAIVNEYVDKFGIKITSPEQLAGTLSGGNQQKVVISKWLANNPKVLVLDEPTRGIDVGSKAEIYRIINDLAQKGCSVILISSELPEIINMCDRIYVMNAGSITGEFDSDEFSQERIMHCAATGVSDENKGGHE